MDDQGTSEKAPGQQPIARLVMTAFAIGLLASFANLLNHHHYPVFTAEVGLVAAVLLIVALLLTGLHRLAQPRLAFLITALVSAIIIDLGTDMPNTVFPLTVVGLAAIAWWREQVVLKLMAAAFSSVLLFQIIDIPKTSSEAVPLANEAKNLQNPATRNAQLRPIVHLILDSCIGLDGMTALGTNFGNLRQEQEQFYLSNGFQLYPGAYSRHAKTINALPELLSYGQAARATEPRNVQITQAPSLAYFNDLDQAGFRTSALTPSFVNFCPNQILSECQNYNRSDLAVLAASELAVSDKALVIGATMLELSQFTALMGGLMDEQLGQLRRSTGRHLYNRAKLYSLTGLSRIDAVTADLANLHFGEARVIHLLLPHDPYVVSRDCHLLPEPDWKDEHGTASFAVRDAAYAEQAHCMTETRIAALLKALDQTEAGRAAIVIIHGDHGSRTLNGVPSSLAGTPDPRSMAVTYSAFFAIRVPGETPTLVPGQFALDELVGAFAATHFSAAPRPQERPAQVWLMDNNWIPARTIPLPRFVQKFSKN